MNVLRHIGGVLLATVVLTATQNAQAQIPPSITTQPQSQTNDYTSDVAFKVSATGTEPLSYQWWSGSQRLLDYDNIAGSQTPTLYLVGVAMQNARAYCVVISNTAGSITSSVVSLTVRPKVLLQDNFENGLGGWFPLFDSIPVGMDNTHNHTTNGAFSAMITNSGQKMYHRLDPGRAVRVRMTIWIYDAGGPQTAYGELRGYTGEVGYARYVPPKGLRQCFAAGIYTADFGTNDTGSLSGETLDPAKYQARVMLGTNAGWLNLDDAGAPNRSPGWHKFQIDRARSSNKVDFYVDDVLSRSIHIGTCKCQFSLFKLVDNGGFSGRVCASFAKCVASMPKQKKNERL